MAVVITVGALIMLTATPASAATGAGGGTGHYSIGGRGISTSPPCAEITSFTYDSVVYAGTYTSGTRAYAGPLQVSLSGRDTDGDGIIAYANPAATYPDDATPGCNTPGSFPVTSNVGGNFNGVSVSCSYNGTFQRVGTHTVTDLQGSCTVTNATGSTASTTREVRNGEMVCTTLGPPPFECDSVDTYIAI